MDSSMDAMVLSSSARPGYMRDWPVNNDAETLDLDCLVNIQGWPKSTLDWLVNNSGCSGYNWILSLVMSTDSSDWPVNRLAIDSVSCKCMVTLMDY